ncbi:MAG: aspartate carbamoyltransferase catalytic subunit [Chloroflexi bacterium]|nr:aspartate carbamoyltransferase catalytic subunit [Chloroflexota bacterium]
MRTNSLIKMERHHIIDLDDFSQEEIALIFATTDAMKEILSREIRRVPTLRGKTIVTLFYEPSTRTRVSFELAAKNLGADVVNVTSSTASVAKGESIIDTMRTLEALGADVIVIRHFQSGVPCLMAQHLQISVINAGDGCHAHPSQALLDLYTIREKLGHIEGLKVVIVGDILHSRVARSNIWGLSAMGAQVVLCGPPTLIPQELRRPQPLKGGECPFPPLTIQENLDRALEEADVVMVLRLQKERQEGGLLPSLREYIQLYQLNSARLSRAHLHALVMHPGPMNEGIEITPEVAHGPQSVVEDQVTNGVAVRMALLYMVTGGKG